MGGIFLNKFRWFSVLLALALLGGTFFAPSPVATAQANQRTFPETGKTVSGRFLDYWNANGGLAQQGYPISNEIQERSDTDGNTYTVQYFERAVFELHPANKAPYDVLLSLLGTFEYNKRYPTGAPDQHASTDNPRNFPETGHTIGGKFRQYWEAHGGLAQQGYPISDEFQEVSALDGKTYTVQYFQRAVFELHPENQPPYDVLLSQLGTFRYHDKYPSGALGTFDHRQVWRSGAKQWDAGRTKAVAGDFNRDGTADVAAFYDYGNNDTALFLFTYNGTGFDQKQVWRSGPHNWSWANTKPLVGDFDGDGNPDIAAFYDYGNDDTALFLFTYQNGAFAERLVWRSGPHNWSWARTKAVAADFTQHGTTDIAAFYDYGNNDTALFLFTYNGTGLDQKQVWRSGPHNWSWANTLPVSGDFNGDGILDIGAFYDYGGADTALFLFTKQADVVKDQQVWRSGAHNWTWAKTKAVAADFTQDGTTDIAAFYDYGADNTGLFLFTGAAGAVKDHRVWLSGTNNWGWARTTPLAGDFNGDGTPDIVAFYDYGGADTALFLFTYTGGS